MNMTWSQVLAVGVVAVVGLGVGVLEVFSGRVPIDPLPPSPVPSAAAGQLPWDLLGPIQFGDLDGRVTDDARGLTGAVKTGRLTVLGVDRQARRLMVVNAAGQVRGVTVGRETVVVRDDKKEADLGLVAVADLIRIEPADGRIEKIIVLRHGWHELASPEH
jgi:hypothetical protein